MVLPNRRAKIENGLRTKDQERTKNQGPGTKDEIWPRVVKPL